MKVEKVFIVGSWGNKGCRSCYFVMDKIFRKKKPAIKYCKSRYRGEYAWSVMKAELKTETYCGATSIACDIGEFESIHTEGLD